MKNIALLSFVLLTQLSFAQNWIKVWSDEFDYTGLPDPAKWSYDIGGSGFGNEELQYYTKERLENASVENGMLTITARKEVYGDNDYTSAKLQTLARGDWKYGRVEVRAKLPTGKGMWPAIWMLPTANTYGGWPNSGEIDIMENVGFDPKTLHFTVHTEAFNHKIGTHKSGKTSAYTPADNFYTYAMDWNKDSINFFVDDNLYFTFKKEGNTSDVWPFDHPFYLILNVAVGGTWGGLEGVDDDIFPQEMLVDYVRVYKQEDESKDEFSITVDAQKGSYNLSPNKSSYSKGEDVIVTAVPGNGYEFFAWSGDYSSTNANITLSMYMDYSLKAKFRKEGEFLQNPSFDDGFNAWDYYGATMTITDGTLKVEVSETTTNPWDRQMSQKGLDLKDGQEYVFSYTAYASKTRLITAGVAQSQSPWSAYYSTQETLTTEPTTFTHTFIMSLNDKNARVVFDFGKYTGDVFIEEVSLMKVEDPLAVAGNKEENFLIYPNPTENNLTISTTTPLNWSVYSLDGVIIKKGFDTTINVSGLKTGNYILEYGDNRTTFTKK